MIQIMRGISRTITDQILDHFIHEIEVGHLPEGTRMPSVRQLASRLNVSAHTAMTAYDRLVSMGLITARPGSGYYVATLSHPQSAVPVEVSPPAPNTPSGFAYELLDSEGELLQASSAFLPPSWLEDAIPTALLVRATHQTTTRAETASPHGCLRLRQAISERLRRRDLPVSPVQVMTTFGATHALHLVARTVAAPGDAVLVDDPGYFFLQSQLSDLGLRIVGIPRRVDGPDMEALEHAVAEYRPRAFFTQSSLQNPTGWNMSIAAIHRLLISAERFGFTVVEDDVYAELAPDHAPRIAQVGGLERVIYIGGYSKVLTPALRLGFVAAKPEIVETLLSLKLSTVLSGSMLEEELLAELIFSGRLTRHTVRLRERIMTARVAAASALRAVGLSCETGCSASPYLWCRLPAKTRAAELATEARKSGLLLAPGDMFSRSGEWTRYLRVNVAHAMDGRVLSFFRSRLL